ncbi:superoxide dismutase family protein [Bacillus sp. NPDC077027]|uniref:superoxide dismutase family protein n=1 Tax=Bacillus sp. NPDC077027 TaxID=3390548 RepID=UPI003CFF905E
MKLPIWISIICLTLVSTSCNAPPKKEHQLNEESKEAAALETPLAKTTLIQTNGKEVGFIEIRQSKQGGLDLHVKAFDLPPGTHGFHIHEVGLCQKPDFETAGSHFNPTQREHGFDNPKGHHAGDMPNLEVGADGKVDVVVNVPDANLKEGPNALLDQDGSSFIIHADADDYLSNPSGNSGKRIVCGALTKEMVK